MKFVCNCFPLLFLWLYRVVRRAPARCLHHHYPIVCCFRQSLGGLFFYVAIKVYIFVLCFRYLCKWLCLVIKFTFVHKKIKIKINKWGERWEGWWAVGVEGSCSKRGTRETYMGFCRFLFLLSLKIINIFF